MHALAGSPTLQRRLEALLGKQALHEAARTAKKEIKGAQRLILHEDLKARMKVGGACAVHAARAVVASVRAPLT